SIECTGASRRPFVVTSLADTRSLPPRVVVPRRPATPTLFPYTTIFRSFLHPPVLCGCHVPKQKKNPSGRQRARPERSSVVKYAIDRKSTRLNSSHVKNSYAVFCLKKKIIRVPPGAARRYTAGRLRPLAW